MRYEKILRLPVDQINSILDGEMGENDSFSYDVDFEDGTKMILRFCGTDEYVPYTECALMRGGYEIALGDPDDYSIEDEWEMEDDDGNTYVVTILPALTVMDNDEFMCYAHENFNLGDSGNIIRNTLDYFKDHAEMFGSLENAVSALSEMFDGIGFEEDELAAVVSSWGLQ